MPKIVGILGHAVVEEYAMYNVKHADGSESVLLEYDIVGAKKLLDRYKQDVDPQNLSKTDVYVVEGILNHRKVGAKTPFLVKWQGYENAVWHTEMSRADLKDSKQAIRDYLGGLEKPKKKTRVTRGRKNQKVRGAKAEESDSNSESTSSNSDSESTSSAAKNGSRDAAEPTTSKRARDSDEKEDESGDSVQVESGGEEEERKEESAEGENEEMMEDEQEESDDEDGSDEDGSDEDVSDVDDDGGMEMAPGQDDDDDEGEEPIVEHPDDSGDDEEEVDANVAHAQGEERRRVRLWNHRWHQYHVLQHEMEYATRFFVAFGFPPLYIPAYDPNGPVALVPPEYEPYVEEPEDDEQ